MVESDGTGYEQATDILAEIRALEGTIRARLLYERREISGCALSMAR